MTTTNIEMTMSRHCCCSWWFFAVCWCFVCSCNQMMKIYVHIEWPMIQWSIQCSNAATQTAAHFIYEWFSGSTLTDDKTK